MKAVPSILLRFFIRLLHCTYRFYIINPERRDEAATLAPRGNYLYAFWHCNSLVGAYLTMDSPCSCIVSASKDGDILISAFKGKSFVIARGSSSRRGHEAMSQMIQDMNSRGIPGINAVDGPRGPARVPKYGIFKIAQETDAPILPLSIYPRRFWAFPSWDKFRLPWPWTKIAIYYGKPIPVGRNLTREDFTPLAQRLKEALDSGERKCLKKGPQ